MRRAIVISTMVAALWGGADAAAATSVVTDCNTHGQLTGHYSVAQLRQALASMPADVKEYTDCYDVIQRALLAQLGASSHGSGGGSGGSGSSGGSFLPTPLIVLLVVLALGGAGLGWNAARRRGRGSEASGPKSP